MSWTILSKSSVPWWHLSGVTDNEPSYATEGVDFRLRLSDDAGLLVSAETARALRVYDSQVSRP